MNPRLVVIDSYQHVGDANRRQDSMYCMMTGETEKTVIKDHEEIRTLLSQKPLKLNLWPQFVMREGYVNIGISSDCDVVCDIRDLHWIETGTVDEIRAVDAVQHFYRADTLRVFEEWLRVLKPGGVLYVEMPDIREFAKKIAEADDMLLFDCQPPLVWAVDGSQMVTNEKNETNRNCMTQSRCKFLLEMAEFVGVEEQKPDNPDFFCPFRLKAVKGGEKGDGE